MTREREYCKCGKKASFRCERNGAIRCRSCHEVNALCCKPIKKTNNRKRREIRVARMNAPEWTASALMRLGTALHRCRDWSRVPDALLEEAYVHVEQRLAVCGSGHRGRSTSRWLGRWQQKIDAELRYRESLPHVGGERV